jgi:hypothetical protein
MRALDRVQAPVAQRRKRPFYRDVAHDVADGFLADVGFSHDMVIRTGST